MRRKKLYNFGVLLAVILIVFSVWSYDENVQKNTQSKADIIRNHSSDLLFPHSAFAQNIGNTSIADVTENSIASVVNIYSTKVISSSGGNSAAPFFDDPFFKRFFGNNFQQNMPKERREQSLGSGVIVDKEGIILTNNHVVADAKKLKVTLFDGQEFDAEIIGTDPKSDLAVIRLKGDFKKLKPFNFGDSDKLRLGEIVLAIGNPFGLQHTVTMGIVSAKGRSGMGIEEYEDFIQTDAAINPGNSGGALINMSGELVGINTAILSNQGSFQPGNQGVGFAIPSNMAKLIVKQLIDGGKVVRGWLGVGIQDVTHDIADVMNLPSSKGVLISDIYEDTPAEKAGLKAGDIITRVNSKDIDNASQLRNKIAILGADVKVTLAVLRDGSEKNIKVKLGILPEDKQLASLGRESGAGNEGEIKALSIAPLNRTNRSNYQIPNDVANGVIVTNIEQDSPAQETGLLPGDVIMEINHKTVDSVDMFIKEYKKSKENVLIYVYRNGRRFFKVLKNNL